MILRRTSFHLHACHLFASLNPLFPFIHVMASWLLCIWPTHYQLPTHRPAANPAACCPANPSMCLGTHPQPLPATSLTVKLQSTQHAGAGAQTHLLHRPATHSPTPPEV